MILHFTNHPLLVTFPSPPIFHNHFRSGMRLRVPIFRLHGLVERISDTYFGSDPVFSSTLFMPTETFAILDDTTVKVISPPFQRRRSASFIPFLEVEHSIPCRSSYYDLNRERGSPRSDLPSVVPIFPWEVRPRHTPRRVFPGDGVPTPGTHSFTSTVRSGYLSALPSPLHDIFRDPTNAGDTTAVRKKSSKFAFIHPILLWCHRL